MSKTQTALVTGASKSIGAATATTLAAQGFNLILFARSTDSLASLSKDLTAAHPAIKIHTAGVDVQDANAISAAVTESLKALGADHIDVLVNNAGLALGAPRKLHELSIGEIDTMVGTNVSGYLYTAHAVLNAGKMAERKRGTIINITSTTGLEVPPFPGEAVYHTAKAAQEAFTNVLRTELQDTSIKVLAIRPGVVATHFHQLRVNYDQKQYDDFMQGFEPLVSEDVADAVGWVLEKPERVSVAALTIQPTAQRTLQVFDREWNERQGVAKEN